MKIILISGNGVGAGKTYLANRLGDVVMSHATPLRQELADQYPQHKELFFSKDQAAKDMVLDDVGGQTVRQTMVAYGQHKCKDEPAYWAMRLAQAIDEFRESEIKFGITLQNCLAVDDLRKMCELEHLRARFPNLLHLHVWYDKAIPEQQYDGDKLQAAADYVIRRSNN